MSYSITVRSKMLPKAVLSSEPVMLLTSWPHAPVQAWGGPAGEQLCGEGPGCPGGRQVDHEPTVCPGCQEGQWDPGVH